MIRVSIHERFWTKVKLVKQGGACWEWIGTTDRNGYGHIWGGPGKGPLAAHRVAYELLVGPIPDGLCLDHLCRNTSCVNPQHLEPVTYAENYLRGKKPRPANQVLTEEQVYDIRCRRAAGERTADLAREFGVVPRTIRDAASGHNFAHVGGPLS